MVEYLFASRRDNYTYQDENVNQFLLHIPGSIERMRYQETEVTPYLVVDSPYMVSRKRPACFLPWSRACS